MHPRRRLTVATVVLLAGCSLLGPPSVQAGPRITLRDLKAAYDCVQILRELFKTSPPQFLPGPSGVVGQQATDKWHLHQLTVTVTGTASNENFFRIHYVDMALPVEVRYYLAGGQLGSRLRRGLGDELILQMPPVEYELLPRFDPEPFSDRWGGKAIVVEKTEGDSKAELRNKLRGEWQGTAHQLAQDNLYTATQQIRPRLQEHLQRLLNAVNPKYKIRVVD